MPLPARFRERQTNPHTKRMSQETITPLAATAQPKSIDAKIAEAEAKEKELYALVDARELEMKPWKDAYEKARAQWSEEWNRLRMLQAIKREGLV